LGLNGAMSPLPRVLPCKTAALLKSASAALNAIRFMRKV
jgi:hypothetical protein